MSNGALGVSAFDLTGRTPNVPDPTMPSNTCSS